MHPEPVRAEPAPTSAAPAAPARQVTAPRGLLRLQSAAGNRAVNALLDSSAGSGAPLPGALRRRAEGASGLDLGDTTVHRDSTLAAAFGADAFAYGRDVHLGAGAEGHLAHEVGHVVQQKLGAVAASSSLFGVAVNRSSRLEADATTWSWPRALGPPGPPVIQGVFQRLVGAGGVWVDQDDQTRWFQGVGPAEYTGADGGTYIDLVEFGPGAGEPRRITIRVDGGTGQRVAKPAPAPRGKAKRRDGPGATEDGADDRPAAEHPSEPKRRRALGGTADEGAEAGAPRARDTAAPKKRGRKRAEVSDAVAALGRGRLASSVADHEGYSDSEDDSEFNTRYGRDVGDGSVMNYTKHGRRPDGDAGKVDNRVAAADAAAAQARLDEDVRAIHDVIPHQREVKPKATDGDDDAPAAPAAAPPAERKRAAPKLVPNQSWGATTITCVLARAKQGDRHYRRFAFSNQKLMAAAVRAKAEALGYHVVKAAQAHSEGEMIQYLHSRAAQYELVAMAVDKDHCADCTAAMTTWFGDDGWQQKSSTETSDKSFAKWYNPPPQQEALGQPGVVDVEWREKQTLAGPAGKPRKAKAKAKAGPKAAAKGKSKGSAKGTPAAR